jgi:predicted RNase H-like HicB family nuclease
MDFTIEIERETDGRWLAIVPALPGVTAYGGTRARAVAAAKDLARDVVADRLAHGEHVPLTLRLAFGRP